MDNLARFDSEGIEIFVNEETSESFASVRGVARMAGVDERTIRRFCAAKGAAQIDVINAEVDTEGGLQGAALLSEGSICKILAKYNPDRLVQFAELGIRTALHQIAGYQNTSISIHVKPKSLLDLSPTQLYQLAAHQLSIEFGKKPDPKLIEGLDREYLQATGDAAFYAYHSISCKIATGTKLANDALREIGWLEVDEKEKKKEDKDIVEFAKHLKWLDDRFAGSRDFHQFESHQLALAAGN
jgi:hypothetical protein